MMLLRRLRLRLRRWRLLLSSILTPMLILMLLLLLLLRRRLMHRKVICIPSRSVTLIGNMMRRKCRA